jgi:small subunit ribosomal protein S8
MQDPIADMLTRLRNATMANLDEVTIPFSKIKAGIADVLKNDGYILDFVAEGEGVKKQIRIKLKYFRKQSVIEGIKRISRPACRIYCGSDDIPKVRNGMGTVVLSTPKGLMNGNEAKRQNIGGEILCHVW